MFGLGIWELVVIAVVALVFLGPERLPVLARQLGRGMRELRRAASELRLNLEDAPRPSVRPADWSVPAGDPARQPLPSTPSTPPGGTVPAAQPTPPAMMPPPSPPAAVAVVPSGSPTPAGHDLGGAP